MSPLSSGLSGVPRVTIVGAGLGGLLLARLLVIDGVAVTIFEQDASSSARLQGGTLDIHADSGQHALRKAGLLDAFDRAARFAHQGMRVFEKDGRLVFASEGDTGRSRPEIDRSQLRSLLLDSIPRDVVHWDCQVRSIECEESGFILVFADGSNKRTSFLVGADGGRSKVRQFLNAELPLYTGVTLFGLTIKAPDNLHPALSQMVGRGMMIAKGDDKKVFAQCNASAEFLVYVQLSRRSRDTHETRESLLKELAGWDERLRDLIRAAEPQVQRWPVDALRPGAGWPHRPNIVLLGDAAHLMPPNGEGANLALSDAADLANVLLHRTHEATEVGQYQQLIISRAAAAWARTPSAHFPAAQPTSVAPERP